VIPNPSETIVALCSAPGPGARAIVRLSGPTAFAIVTGFVADLPAERRRRCISTCLELPSAIRLPADVYLWPGPRSYTGQDVVELHTLAAPPLIELLVQACLDRGARAALPGEFTMRAFLAGKLDLTRAEAVLAVIDAGNRNELKQALAQLAGGVARPLAELREDLLNLLADVEAGLDFADEDIRFVPQEQLLHRLTRGLALLTLLRKQLDERALSGQAFRVVLAGKPNAGKSSLFNALAGKPAALVHTEPGTTRDYLVERLQIDGTPIELVDTAGLRDSHDDIESRAQTLGQKQAEIADLILVCREAGAPHTNGAATTPHSGTAQVRVATKCDMAAAGPGELATSAVTGQGIAGLRKLLVERARAAQRSPLAPSLSRCRHHVEACLANLRRAHAEALDDSPAELIALELRDSLDQIGALTGAVHTDDLLDRVFSRFCIGK